MKLFSWSNLFLVLSLSFLWGCGYWIWWQTALNQQHRTQEQLSIQLERAEVALSDWQHSHQLHLEYLQNALQNLSLQQDNPLYDPKLELDDKIQRTRWPDPLLGYAVLDDAGRAMLLSNHRAGQLYPLTTVDFSQQQPFLTPLVTRSQWIAPLQLNMSGQHLVLWFDLSSLQQRLRKLVPDHGELLLISQRAELVSPSRYQTLLLQRFGLTDSTEEGLLRWSLKRPPEDLSRSKQRYDSSTAWPATRLASLLSSQRHGMTPLYIINYLGKPSVAAWRWSAGWQAFVVAELDFSQAQQQRQQQRQWLLAGLSGITVVLLLIFYLLQRSNGTELTEPKSEPVSAALLPAAAKDDERVQPAAAGEQEPEQLALQTAASVLQAWLQGQLSADELQQVSRDWLCQHRQPSALPAADNKVLVPLPQLLHGLLQELQRQYRQGLSLEFSPDLQRWYWLAWPLLAAWLNQLLASRLAQSDVTELNVRVLVAGPLQLRLELTDDGQSLTSGQWQQWQQTAPQWQALADAGLIAEQVPDQFSGNKTVVMLPAKAQADIAEVPEVQFVDATALLLCPPGAIQQTHSRQLRCCGLNLLPLDDAAQFVQWCTDHPGQQLDYLVLDDSVIRNEPALMEQVAAVVRRYFPAVSLVLLAATPERWQELQSRLQLRVVAKPSVQEALIGALQAAEGGLFAAAALRVHLYVDQPLQGFLLQQMLRSLGYQPQVHDLQQSDYSASAICLYPAGTAVEVADAALYYAQQQTNESRPAALWLFSDGLAALSEHLFDLQYKKSVI